MSIQLKWYTILRVEQKKTDAEAKQIIKRLCEVRGLRYMLGDD